MLEDQALAGLSSLALLDLSRNQLGTISRETLQPLASLQVLRLTGNFLGARGSHAKAAPLATVVALRSQPAVERDPVAALGGGGGGGGWGSTTYPQL